MAATATGCPLCSGPGGLWLWQDAHCRVIRATGDEVAAFPVFYRVVWQAHVAEWSDLDETEQAHCMRVLTAVERSVRRHLAPTKVNLAALGNVVPHLHWHVVARYDWDSHFPAPLWAAPQRALDASRWQALASALQACDDDIASGVFLS